MKAIEKTITVRESDARLIGALFIHSGVTMIFSVLGLSVVSSVGLGLIIVGFAELVTNATFTRK